MIGKGMIEDLGEGLILRKSRRADCEALARFNGVLHAEGGAPSSPGITAWTRDLFKGNHPTFKPEDFTLVEDTRTGEIVSSCCLISQVWSFGGVPIKVGRPELVGTHPDYRKRGLIRKQFETLHAWSSERGELLQAITGIEWYYRQFEYEMAMELGGGRVGYRVHLPDPVKGKRQDYQFRSAKEADASFLSGLSKLCAKRYLVSCIRNEAIWRYEISGKRRRNETRMDVRVIESREGGPFGYLLLAPRLWGPSVVVRGYEIESSESWQAITPSVLHFLRKRGEELAAREKKKLGAFALWMGTQHPAYEVIGDKLPRKRDPYTWYLRVSDLKKLLKTIGPVLERRLSKTNLITSDSLLRLNFYRYGLKLVFKEGKLSKVEADEPEPYHLKTASFPDQTFLQLLFGYRSLEELEYAFPDCSVGSDATRVLVNVLFPKRPSNVWGMS